MEPEVIQETGNLLFTWLNEEGARNYLVVYGMAWTILLPIGLWLCSWGLMKHLAKPIARIAVLLEKLEDER